MIKHIDADAREYLSAAGCACCYVAARGAIAVRVGIARDPIKAMLLIKGDYPGAELDWLAWFDDKNAAGFVVDILDRRSGLLSHETARTVLDVVGSIGKLAQLHEVMLTPHERAIERAKSCTHRLDTVLVALQQAGHLHSFNRAYQTHREAKRAQGESVVPYWIARNDLRRLLIQQLIAAHEVDLDAALKAIRERFPWFKQYGEACREAARKTSA